MDDDQERRHLCRECDRSFSDGRVLGGHMRGHMIRRNAREKKILKEAKKKIQEGYGLRENPKKSWKSSLVGIDPNPTPKPLLDSECRICGKGFASDKALFGHMRLHSTGEKKMKAMESDLGYCPVRGKRSIRVHYDVVSSDTEEEEKVKEVAFCLMLLSRGVRNMEGCDSFDKLVENEVVGLEMMESQSAESSSIRNGVRDREQKKIDQSSKHKCSICRKGFVSARALGSHKRSHTMKNTAILGAAKKIAFM